MKKIIIILPILLVLIAGGAGAYVYFAEEPVEEVAVEDGEKKESVDDRDPIFLRLDPVFVVNIVHQGKLHYLQAGLEVMHRDQETIDDLKLRLPVIRNNMIMILSDQSYEDLNTKAAMLNLRTIMADTISKVLGGEEGMDDPVEVYITSFVIQ